MVRFLELISIYMGKNNKYRNWMVAPMNEVNELFTKENVEQLCAQVNEFIYNIECQLPPTVTSEEDFSLPFE